ncbi:MAG TPA: hypothetical protein VKB16_04285 [Beijerinckiaceae bacterium]|nr:hypothetical protein [Beijerinckiaceae bacterium]
MRPDAALASRATARLRMVKSFITGTAQGVTDSVKRVTNIMKGRPDPHAEKQAAAMERKELGKRASPKSPPGKTG